MYEWIIFDPQLDNIEVVDRFPAGDEDYEWQDDDDDIDEEAQERFLEHCARQLRAAQPFLTKYGLVMELYCMGMDEDLTEIELVDDGLQIDIDVLPRKDNPGVKNIIEDAPWLSLDTADGIEYPLYWRYDRNLRREKMIQEGNQDDDDNVDFDC